MKTNLISVAALATVLLSTSYAASPRTGNSSKNVPKEFDAETRKWKPAGPTPAVTHNPPAPPRPWSWKRAAMQPIRLIVMAAKVPILAASIPSMEGAIALHNAREWTYFGDRGNFLEFIDFTPAIENFDPGSAIDEDIFREGPNVVPVRQGAPSPIKSELRISRATPSAPGRKGEIVVEFNRESKAPSKPPGKATVRNSVAATGKPLSDLDLMLICSGRRSAINTDLHLPGPQFASNVEQARMVFGTDLQIFDKTPSSVPRAPTTLSFALNR